MFSPRRAFTDGVFLNFSGIFDPLHQNRLLVDVEEAVRSSQAHLMQHEYPEAWDSIKHIPSTNATESALLKTFQSVCICEDQGCFATASFMLESRMAKLEDFDLMPSSNIRCNLDGLEGKMLRLLLAWLRIFSDGMLDQAVEMCLSLRELISDLLQKETLSGIEIQLILTWFQILITAETFSCNINDGEAMSICLSLVPGAVVQHPEPEDDEALQTLKSTWPRLCTLRLRLLRSGFVETAFAFLSLAFLLTVDPDTDLLAIAGVEAQNDEFLCMLSSRALSSSDKSKLVILARVVGQHFGKFPRPDLRRYISDILPDLSNGRVSDVTRAALSLETYLWHASSPEEDDFWKRVISFSKIEFDMQNRRHRMLDGRFIMPLNLERTRSEMEKTLAVYDNHQYWDGVFKLTRALGALGTLQGQRDRASQTYMEGIKVAEKHQMGAMYILEAHLHLDALSRINIAEQGLSIQDIPKSSAGDCIEWYESFLIRYPRFTIQSGRVSVIMRLLDSYSLIHDVENAGKQLQELASNLSILQNILPLLSPLDLYKIRTQVARLWIGDDLEKNQVNWGGTKAQQDIIQYLKGAIGDNNIGALTELIGKTQVAQRTSQSFNQVFEPILGNKGQGIFSAVENCNGGYDVSCLPDTQSEGTQPQWLTLAIHYAVLLPKLEEFGIDHREDYKLNLELIEELEEVQLGVSRLSLLGKSLMGGVVSQDYEPITLYLLAKLRHYILRNIRTNSGRGSIEAGTHIEKGLQNISTAAKGLKKNLSLQAGCQKLWADLLVDQLIEEPATTTKLFGQVVPKAVMHFEESQTLLDEIRQELSCVTNTMEAWKLKRGFVEEEYLTANNAIALLTEVERVGDAWEWVQRSKAASMADMLRIHIQVPEALKESLGEHDRALLQKEQNLVSKIANTKDDLVDLRYELHEQHQGILRQMRATPSLQQIMVFRGQLPMSFANFNSFILKLPQNVVWIDWAVVGDCVTMYVVRASKPPQSFDLGEYATVKSWVEENLDQGINELRGHPEELRRLDFLVQPLGLVCSSSDILVLCPTRLLHRIPLHALQVGEEVMGVRNRVVQCPSAITFHHMFLQRESRSSSIRTHFEAQIIGNPAKDDFDIIRSSTSSSCYEVAAKLKTLQVHVEEDLTVRKFKQYATAVDILHYHGHSIYSSSDEASVGLPLQGSETLRVSDVIDLKMKQGAHISLIACSSKDRKITTAGDEQLGFVSAFIFAGASSCIATLWKVPSTTGKAFSDGFYSAWEEKQKLGIGIDLAECFRQATRKLRDNPATHNPFHWAAFVFIGYWEF